MTSRKSSSRRRFLLQGGAAAAGVALFGSARGRPIAAAPRQEPAAPAAPPQAPAQQPEAAKPEAVAALPPGFDRDVYLARIESARAIMREGSIGAIIETPGAGLRYLTGLPLERYERLICLVLPAEGAPTLLCPAMDREIVAAGPGVVEAIRYVVGEDDPLNIVADLLRQAGQAEGRAAESSGTIYDEFASVHAMLPK